ncbi:MAG: hypothetical protein DRP41_01415 [Thermodesulfobacteriota bacterium]|nr:MAG: hypothetical protein DRP41_01415 [Thermodesulfobacteriota bacterium]
MKNNSINSHLKLTPFSSLKLTPSKKRYRKLILPCFLTLTFKSIMRSSVKLFQRPAAQTNLLKNGEKYFVMM